MKYFVRFLKALMCKKVLAAVITAVGAIYLAVSGRDLNITENTVETAMTIISLVLIMLGYDVALKEPTKKR